LEDIDNIPNPMAWSPETAACILILEDDFVVFARARTLLDAVPEVPARTLEVEVVEAVLAGVAVLDELPASSTV
jgi:hypothetical protein